MQPHKPSRRQALLALATSAFAWLFPRKVQAKLPARKPTVQSFRYDSHKPPGEPSDQRNWQGSVKVIYDSQNRVKRIRDL